MFFQQGDYQDDNASFSTEFYFHPDQQGNGLQAQPPGSGHRHYGHDAGSRYERQRVWGEGGDPPLTDKGLDFVLPVLFFTETTPHYIGNQFLNVFRTPKRLPYREGKEFRNVHT